MTVSSARYYLDNPVKFVEQIIGAKPDDQQALVLNALCMHNPIAVRSGHGIGKTAVAAWAVLWFLSLHPLARIPCTAPTGHQLEDVLWPEVKKWLDRSKLRDTMIWTKTRLYVAGYESTWFAVPRSASKAENLQGFHADHVLFIIDEASGMEQDIMEVVEGAMTNAGAILLMIGNPTQISGTFHAAFHKDRDLYQTYVFNSENSPLVTKEYCERIAAKYGRESDVYRVRVLGEFPKGTPDAFIRLDEVESAIMRDVDGEGPWTIGVDPARYGDNNSVIYFRQGFKVYPPVKFHGINTSRLTGEVIRVVKEIRGIDPDAGLITVNVDDTGIGGGVTDQLELQETEMEIEVMPQNNGGAGDADYDNQGAAMWGCMKEMLTELSLPDDPDLISQLTTRKYVIRPNGKIRLERKEDMTKRGLYSPDDGDGLSLCCWEPRYGTIRMV